MTNIKYVTGDATCPTGTGFKVIVHVCNNVGAWGAGFVIALSNKWPITRIEYLSSFSDDEPPSLGSVQYVAVCPDVIVVNMIAQEGLRDERSVPLRYDALRVCLLKVAEYAESFNASVHMPRIGCGLAGGKWKAVEKIVKETLCYRDIPVTVYDLE